MMQFTDTSEKGFQKLIVKQLVESNQYVESTSNDFDKEFCMNPAQLWQFIETTQPEAYAMIQRKGEREFLNRLDKKIRDNGVIEVLSKGVKHFDRTIDLFYRQPASAYNSQALLQYQANIFSVTEELVYSNDNANRLDLTIFLNGIPIITCELKNPLSEQTVHKGMRQYQTDRDPKEKIFSFARCMVHFAADTELVFMTTKLNRKRTSFLPFNKGLNEGKPKGNFGAGNPVNPKGLKTHYFWEEVLTKDSLANIITHFAKVVEEQDEETKKTRKLMIFPRYHQLTAVRQLLAHAKEYGTGKRYLIQHSAGSGKSKSIAWLSHQLHGLFDASGKNHLFDSVIIITDRIVLDKQLSEDIKQFSPRRGIVEHITGVGGSKTSQLKDALANRKKVIVCTVQTFPFLLDEMAEMPTMNFAIIIDEAHSGQSGLTSSKMNAVLANKEEDEGEEEEKSLEDKINELIESRKMITNGSYFAFTATPKNKTLETFGVKSADTYTDDEGNVKSRFYAFHVYSMKQAIEEGFILDVLKNYTTLKSFYKLVKSVEENPEFDTKRAQQRLKAYVEGHEFAIGEKAKIMIDHFHREVKHLINGEAKAMVVTKSIISAIKYKYAFDEYLKEIKSPYKAVVAFSGKKPYKGVEHDEVSINSFKSYKTDIPRNFKKSEYRFLIVANKYQTGFDQPLLHTMYVDKKLDGVQAVQTLSRLNRAKNYKKDTFVLDFRNETEDIKEAFDPYYTATILSEETNPNKLNDLVDKLEVFEVYTEYEVDNFFEKYIAGEDRTKLDPIIDRSAEIFKDDLTQDQKIEFKSSAKSFMRVYSYLSKIIDFNNKEWEKLFWFFKFLVPKLYIEQSEDLTEGILESIDLDSYRPIKEATENITLAAEPSEVQGIPVEAGGSTSEPDLDTLENILSMFNQRFGDIEWSDKDKVRKILTEDLPSEMRANKELMEMLFNSDKQNAKITSDKKVEEILQGMLFTQSEIYQKFSSNPDLKRRYQEYIFDMMMGGGADKRPPVKP